ncbi:MAG TPA: ribosomal protein S18-alanine N-acetyltransferase [Syntrophales bacterium]|nr:ribosomal protein S18-alanine N-acetyltransferase [Syntrophales bacterium]HRT26778.1 ribosomal protein S18-alanine N-acetyltransferase [Syntrophales bacterium]
MSTLEYVTLREMEEGDLDQVMAIETVSFRTPWTVNMFKSELRARISRNLVVLAGACGRQEIAGYVSFWVFADESHLNSLAVRDDFRRRGVASKLLEAMVERSKKEGALRGTLEVRESNQAAIALYERYGYVVAGRRRNYYDDTKEDALIMWCDFRHTMKRTPSDDL